MICPSCKTDLEKAIMANVEIDYCPRCLGIWFEENELNIAKDAKDIDLRWLDIDLWQDKKRFEISKKTRQCPVCRLPLYEVKYGGSNVAVDVCSLCKGVWLDRGEFKNIIDYLKKKGQYDLMNDFTEILAQESWEIFTGPEGFREELLDFLKVLKLMQYKFLVQHPHIMGAILTLSDNINNL